LINEVEDEEDKEGEDEECDDDHFLLSRKDVATN